MKQLGTGQPSVFIADRGGGPLLGEVTGVTTLSWNRVRDDQSSCRIVVAAPSLECCALLGQARSVRHEIVVYRNGVRVWEGPITRISYGKATIEIDARDVMWYASRRALEVDLDFSFPNQGSALLASYLALRDAFGPSNAQDPNGFNAADYVQTVRSADDARTAKVIPAYSRTCWEVVDEYAQSGGIDYTTVGRRVLIWDVHTAGWYLPDMQEDWFSDALRVVEYGSELATRVFRTTNNGESSEADAPQPWLDYYGTIDRVDSDRDEGDGNPTTEDLAEMELVAVSELEDAYPAPLRVLVPASVQLLPCAEVDINDLIPGAWCRVRVSGLCRGTSEWQKLDEMRVDYSGGEEFVRLRMTTAPSRKEDPIGYDPPQIPPVVPRPPGDGTPPGSGDRRGPYLYLKLNAQTLHPPGTYAALRDVGETNQQLRDEMAVV